jgi:ferredoxin-NADP reductase
MQSPPWDFPALDLRVHEIRAAAEHVVSIDLRAADGADLPAFEAGAHIDLELLVPDGRSLRRQYSLSNDASERHRYIIGVSLEPASRGGSAFIHRNLSTQSVLRAGHPRNHFALDESAEQSVFVAGGIGITPMLGMARRLSAIGRPWTLYYCVRSPSRAAFLPDLLALPYGTVIPVFDGMAGVVPLDLHAVVAAASPLTHLYCCGPSPLMQAFASACALRDPLTVHVEWFAPPPSEGLSDQTGAFRVRLARAGRTIDVPPEKLLLDVLIEAGVTVPSICKGGACGTCAVRVLDGEPDHRDFVLSEAERQLGDQMLVCVSRSKSAVLTLDL